MLLVMNVWLVKPIVLFVSILLNITVLLVLILLKSMMLFLLFV